MSGEKHVRVALKREHDKYYLDAGESGEVGTLSRITRDTSMPEPSGASLGTTSMAVPTSTGLPSTVLTFPILRFACCPSPVVILGLERVSTPAVCSRVVFKPFIWDS